jgi:hypothetical protein
MRAAASQRVMMSRFARGGRPALLAAIGLGLAAPLAAQQVVGSANPVAPQPADRIGPFNVDFPAGGDGLARPLAQPQAFGGAVEWTLTGWVEVRSTGAQPALVGGVGGPGAAAFITSAQGQIGFWNGSETTSIAVPTGGWHHVAVTARGGTVMLSVDGQAAQSHAPPAFTAPALSLAPRGVAGFGPFDGRIAGFVLHRAALPDAEIAALARARPDPSLILFDTGSPAWPIQFTNMPGMVAPQEAWTLPRSKAPYSRPVATPAYAGPALAPRGARAWTLPKWELIAEDEAGADAATIAAGADMAKGWRAATVPGTVLTTLVDRGVYPDPSYGLNNMAIPESLGRRAWWYRTRFTAPADLGAHPLLTFNGINAVAEVWLNGAPLGTVRGAFIRGQFDVAGQLRAGENILAVRILPPRHPGIAHEQSLTAGWGPNGGVQALDGPTFFPSEGWDWIPGVRDRNIGLWQDVVLSGSGALRIGDPQIVTTLPRGDTSVADVEIDVPVRNLAAAPARTRVTVSFDGIGVAREIDAPPGETVVRFTPADFPQLSVPNPRLWWPNGYGEPALHSAHISLAGGGGESDARDVRFGMRQITYELSLMSPGGALRRVEVDYSKARQLGEQITDARHEGIRKVPGGWVNSLTAAGDLSPAVRPLADARLAPFLVLKVNGVRIAARGGSWGTDDFMKRSSRARLEPYFRLHRDAGVNIIRNWVGQNTQDSFYDLADEYGLLVTNDFWASTQNYQMEPEDVPLFLANARDTISRYRNHPSIALWFGRNEGVPQPVLNEGLERLVRELDGTRWYTGSSNSVNLWFSGPYDYREPETYFTEHDKGFAVEVGSQSFPTLEAFEAMTAPADRWPISDSWAYHDWHQNGNGDTHPFMASMTAKLGAPRDLPDFERKAQLLTYESYRAIMEGMNAELWSRNSGRMLWMTQPAWPSTMWQILSHDYDTHAAFYGFKSAAEPVHVQLTLPDHRVQLVNNRQADLGARVRLTALTPAGQPALDESGAIDVAAGQVADLDPGLTTRLDAALKVAGALVVRLEASGADGAPLSRNLYWLTAGKAGWQQIAAMAPQPVTIAAAAPAATGDERSVTVTLRNTGTAPALTAKLTLLAKDGSRVLPAYYSDNYVSLLPGEARTVTIRYPAALKAASVALRGWNVAPARAAVR